MHNPRAEPRLGHRFPLPGLAIAFAVTACAGNDSAPEKHSAGGTTSGATGIAGTTPNMTAPTSGTGTSGGTTDPGAGAGGANTSATSTSVTTTGGPATTSGPGNTGGAIETDAARPSDATVESSHEGADVTPPASDASAVDASTRCPAPAAICEDFEPYPSGTTDLTPNWLTYTYKEGAVHVDGTKPFHGTQSLHLTTPAGGRRYADLVKINPPERPLFPNKHYGRAMVWLTNVPSQAHYLINHASGPLASDPSTVAKYSYGGKLSLLEPTYSQKMPVGGVNNPALRGGGPEDGDPYPAPVDCYKTATSQRMPLRRWVCWEWMFDADASETHLWIDGVPMTEVDIARMPDGACRAWKGPKLFNKMVIGWDVYTSPSEFAQEAWIDDIVVSAQRVGCAAP